MSHILDKDCLVMDRMAPAGLPVSARLRFLSVICRQSLLEIAIVSDCGSLTSKGTCKFHNTGVKMPADLEAEGHCSHLACSEHALAAADLLCSPLLKQLRGNQLKAFPFTQTHFVGMQW